MRVQRRYIYPIETMAEVEEELIAISKEEYFLSERKKRAITIKYKLQCEKERKI